MSRRYQHDLVAIERTCGEDPTVLTIGNGIWISTGWNDAGLNLTGNELSPNDERDRHPARDPGPRDAARADAGRHARRRAAPRSRVVVQQRARRRARRGRQRRGIGHRRGRGRGGRARPPGPHEPLRLRPDAPLRGRSRVRGAVATALRAGGAAARRGARRLGHDGPAPLLPAGSRGRAGLALQARGAGPHVRHRVLVRGRHDRRSRSGSGAGTPATPRCRSTGSEQRPREPARLAGGAAPARTRRRRCSSS